MTLFLGLLFGSVGAVYLAIGRRQHEPTWLVCGFILIIYPYFLSNALLIILLGVAVAAFPIARHKGMI